MKSKWGNIGNNSSIILIFSLLAARCITFYKFVKNLVPEFYFEDKSLKLNTFYPYFSLHYNANLTALKNDFFIARCNGVTPLLFLMFGSHPFSNNRNPILVASWIFFLKSGIK